MKCFYHLTRVCVSVLMSVFIGHNMLCYAETLQPYSDGRPAATLRMNAKDHGIVLRYGDGPSQCDILGARDVWVFEDKGTYYMHYDAAGPKGWLSSLAVSKDLLAWEKKGPILDFGKPGEDDSASASYGVTYKDGTDWHMFYLGTPKASSPPNRVPTFPYLTMKAKANSPTGPWTKQYDVVPFRIKPDTYYSRTASPGHVVKNGDEYLQFFSATTRKPGNPCPQRTLGIARTKDLDGPWTVDPTPMVPIEEQIENSSLYYEEAIQTWFLFTNHVGIDGREYTDAIWVYWSKDLKKWDAANKAVVLDGQNCTWSSKCIGLPSIVQTGKRLALFYDAPGGNSTSHMKRNVGLAWLDLPLTRPETEVFVAKRIKVTDQRCEYLEDPLGIDVTRPRLSWRLESGQRGQRQTAYHLLVASSPEKLAQNTGDLWDSGKVRSDQSIHVAYDGKALVSRVQCFWKVMVWDKDGMASEWSDTARWSMGLLHPEDWKAQWIGVAIRLKPRDVTVTKASYQTLDASVVVDVTAIVKQELAKDRPLTVHYKTLGGDPARGMVKELVVEYTHQGKAGIARAKDFETLKWTEAPTSPFYRQSFSIDEMPERATIYIAPLGYFELYVNGQKVGDEVLAPVVSNFSKRSYYRAYDVAQCLLKGANSLGIWMGTGWYSPGLPGVKHDSPVVRAQLELSGNGKEKLVITDTSWQTKSSERRLLGEWRWGKFGGEQVDMRRIDRQWWDTEASTSGWTASVEVQPADALCSAQPCAGNHQLPAIMPASVEPLDEDTVLVDFGTNLTGLMNMTFRGLKPAQKVTLYYADLDGRQKEEAWRAKQTRKGFAVYGQFDEFISAGAAQEQFKNVFNYHAFRYVLIEGLGYLPQKSDMAAVPVETEVAEAGTFSCSNELYNRIHEMVRWTYRCLNLGGQTVDCPHRERLGYGDGQTIMDTGLFNFDAASLYAKWSRNWWDEQKEDGYVPFTAPCPHGTGGGPAWGAMCIMVPWKAYLFSNDRRLLEQGYPYMKKYLGYLSAHCEDDILQEIFPDEKWPNLGDWVPPRRGMDTQNWPDKTMRLVFNNCYRVHLLQIMQRVAGLLGKDGDARTFEHDMLAAQGKIHQTFFDPKNNTYANGEQPYLIFPMKAGVTPDALRDAVFEEYVETLLVKDKGHLNTGMIGTQIMTDYLLEMDRNDLVDAFVNKTTYPGWGYMIEKGATTCWEQWNGYYSQIHSCFPYIGGWFYRGLAGIRWDPKAPGFKHVILRSGLVKSVDWVKCRYDSPYGKIVSNWKRENGLFRWHISIPVNSWATVFVPAKDIKSIREGATSLQKARGVTFLRMEGRSAVLRVESGRYEFVSEHSEI